jgi:hypothetical protein
MMYPAARPEPCPGGGARRGGRQPFGGLPIPGRNRIAVGRDGRVAGTGLRYAAPPGKRVPIGLRMRAPALEHPQNRRAALGGIPGSAGQGAVGADDRRRPRRPGVHHHARPGVARLELRRQFFRSAVQKCQDADGTFPSITPHSLRHTAASLAVSASANVKALQRMLTRRPR